jgi:CelD/BcsL family acetyltransferase involved in cellulose biosynthesis
MDVGLQSARAISLRPVVVFNPGSLERYRTDWLELLGNSDSNEPMLSPDWMLLWWRVFGGCDGRRLRVVLFFADRRLVGLAPLLWRRHWYRPGIPFARIEPLGTGENEKDSVWSEYLNVIAERGCEEAVALALARYLAVGELGHWDEFVLPAMNGESDSPTLLANAFHEMGMSADWEVADRSPYIALPNSWDAYLQSLSSSKRYFITRSLRELEKWAGDALQFHVAQSLTELEEGKRILLALHLDRWANDGPARAFRSRRFTAFHDLVIPAFWQEGAIELAWLSIRDEPIAALYNIVWNDKVYFYQSGRRLDLPANLRPGVALHAYAIQNAIRQGRREYDFLGGPSRYKLKFAPESRPLVQFRATRRPDMFRERARRAAARAIGGAKAVRDAVWKTRPSQAPECAGV